MVKIGVVTSGSEQQLVVWWKEVWWSAAAVRVLVSLRVGLLADVLERQPLACTVALLSSG